MNFFKRNKFSTFAKYLLSYIAIFSVLIGGFFLILRSQLVDTYHTQRTDQILKQMQSVSSRLEDELTFLSQIDELLSTNPDIKIATYTAESKYYQITNNELIQYAKSSSIIDSIVYVSKLSNHVFSTDKYVTYQDGCFTLANSTQKTVLFDPTPYFDATAGQLIYLSDNNIEFLLYFPPNRTNASYLFFYILDIQLFQSHIKTLISTETPAAALIDDQGQCVTNINFDPYQSNLDMLPLPEGIYRIDDSLSLCSCENMYNNYSIVAIISEDFLARQVNALFLNAYLSLLALSLLGILLIYFAMVITYQPLNNLIQGLPHHTYRRGENYVDVLSESFFQLSSQKQQLQQSLDNYRTFVQRDLLGNILTQQCSIDPILLDKILEASSSIRELRVIKCAGSNDDFNADKVLQQLSEAFASYGYSFCLNKAKASAFYLIIICSAQNYEKQLKEVCHRIHQESGYLFALSNPSNSMLEMPLLYENASTACSAWPQEPITEYHLLNASSHASLYPREEIHQISSLLANNQFSEAREIINTLFTKMDKQSTKSSVPSYLSNCVILDLLTILSNGMSKTRIDFDSYSTLFYEASNLCRPCQTKDSNNEELHSLISELLYLYEKESTDRLSQTAPLYQVMESNFCQPDFSISVIADTYHVSVSRMSVLFKKEMGIGFADYLWQMRLKKAKELLTATELSIDEISLTVGYLNPNSFRRKFKQETGLTPTQFRETIDQSFS